MTNEAYTLMETNRDRAIVRRSARYKKGGSKSKKCTLGHEYKSKKELDKMNGEVKSWKMTDFYSWQEFKQMPEDIQVEYINHLLDTYKIGITAIGPNLFHISKVSLERYLANRNLKSKIHKCDSRGGAAINNVKVFVRDIKEHESKDFKSDQEPEIIEEGKYLAADDILVRCSMSFSTEYIAKEVDLSEIVEIEKMFKGRKMRVSISIEAVDTGC